VELVVFPALCDGLGGCGGSAVAGLGEPTPLSYRASLAAVAGARQCQTDEAAERAQERQVLVLVGSADLRARGQQARDRPLAVGAVAAHEQVGAAQGLPTIGTGGELSPGAFGERPVGAGDHLLLLAGSLEAQFRLGQPGSRSLELAGGCRELTFLLACALVLSRIQAVLEERDDRRGEAQAAFASAGRKRLLMIDFYPALSTEPGSVVSLGDRPVSGMDSRH